MDLSVNMNQHKARTVDLHSVRAVKVTTLDSPFKSKLSGFPFHIKSPLAFQYIYTKFSDGEIGIQSNIY